MSLSPKLPKIKPAKPCPRCYAPTKLTPAGWVCDRHGLTTEKT